MQRGAPPAAMHDAHRKKEARQVIHVAHIVAVAEMRDDIGQYRVEIFRTETLGAADANVETFVLTERAGDDPLTDDGFHHQVARFGAELFGQLVDVTVLRFQQLVAYVQGCMRPGALREITDDLTDALVAFDQNDVTFAERFLELERVVGYA